MSFLPAALRAALLQPEPTITFTKALGMFDQDTAGREATAPWSAFVQYCSKHNRRETKEDARDEKSLGFTLARFGDEPCTCGDPPSADRKGCPDFAWTEGEPHRGHRITRNVIAVTALGVDLDKGEDGKDLDQSGMDRALARIHELGVEAVLYSSHSYAPPEKCSLRGIFQLSREVSSADWSRFRKAAIKWLAIPDGCPASARHFWWAPSCPPSATPYAKHFPGRPLPVDEIMALAEPAPKPKEPRESRDPAPGGFDPHAFMERNFPGSVPVGYRDGTRWTIECPWVDEHTTPGDDATVTVEPDLPYDFKCWHAHCAGRDWRHLRERFDRTYAGPEMKPVLREVTDEAVARQATSQQASNENAPPAPEPGTWAHAFMTAFTDVQRALGTGTDTGDRYREPLFEAAIELFGRDYPPTPWLVDRLITEHGVGAVSTEPKSGKTWLGTEIAVGVATGTRVCGEFSTGPARHVGYLYAEDLAPQVRNRLRALGAARGMEPERVCEHLHVQPRGKFLDILQDKDLAWIVASCRRMPQLALLVLDPLRDLHSGEEDKSDSMRDVMRRLRVLSALLGCAVLFVHHAKKDTSGGSKRGGQQMRGSSAIHGAVDFGIYLSGLTGDGQTVFTNTVESEVKGARGGGVFTLTLTIEDSAAGEALEASWTVERPDKGKKATEAEQGDDAALLAVIAQNAAGAHEGWEDVWRLARVPNGDGLSQGRALAARARLLASPARIELDPIHSTGRRKVYKPVGVTSR